MTALLSGVRILAVELYGAGPYGTQLMAELGAEVIKIEAPSMGGDVSRATGPHFLGTDDSQFFQTFSRSKKSVALEIKTPEGRAEFERLQKVDPDTLTDMQRAARFLYLQRTRFGGLVESSIARFGEEGRYQDYYIASRYTVEVNERPVADCWGAFTQVRCTPAVEDVAAAGKGE